MSAFFAWDDLLDDMQHEVIGHWNQLEFLFLSFVSQAFHARFKPRVIKKSKTDWGMEVGHCGALYMLDWLASRGWDLSHHLYAFYLDAIQHGHEEMLKAIDVTILAGWNDYDNQALNDKRVYVRVCCRGFFMEGAPSIKSLAICVGESGNARVVAKFLPQFIAYVVEAWMFESLIFKKHWHVVIPLMQSKYPSWNTSDVYMRLSPTGKIALVAYLYSDDSFRTLREKLYNDTHLK